MVKLIGTNSRSKIKHSLIFWSRILVLLYFILALVTRIKAQNLDDEVCLSGGNLEMDYRKKPWKGDNSFLKKYLEEIGYFENKEMVRYLVPLKFWVYHDKKGDGGASIADIKDFITDLNKFNALNNTGFQFYTSDIKHINNSNRLVFGYYFETTFQTLFRHTKSAVNVYLIDAFKKKQESRRIVKGTFNMFTKSIVIQRKNSSTGLTHEVGHYFGLLHPHRHYNKGKSKQEPVSRSRTMNSDGKGAPLCESRGDFLADTKAEPKLTFLVDNNCNFKGQALKDAWGDYYQSEVNNIMSYPTHYSCRDSFTLSQKAVMLYSAANGKFARFWNTGDFENKKYGFDKNEPDDYKDWAGSISPGIKEQFNFHKIFIGKHTDRSDTCDWVKFEVKSEDKRNVRILVKSDEKNISPLKATFYDKNLMTLSKQTTAAAGQTIELGFKGVVSDWYYIYIISSENNSEHVDNYSIEVELFD